MTVGEINDYITCKTISDSEHIIISSWKTINFLSQMILGKLKNLEDYLPKKKMSNGIVVNSYKDKLIKRAKEKAKQLGHI